MNQQNKEQKPHLSASQLTMYERCSEAYRRRYIEHQIIPPGIALVKGSGVHGGSKVNFRQKIESQQDLPKSEIIDISVSVFDKKLNKDGVLLTPDEETVGYKKVVGDARDSVVTLSSLYSDYVAPEYLPKFVEEKQTIEIPKASHDLVAVMDMADVRNIIADLKTGKKKKQQSEVDTSEQLSFYALVFKALTGELPAMVRLEALIDKKNPEHQRLEAYRTMDDLQVVINRLNVMIMALRKGVFTPTLATNWWCSSKFCGYWQTCPYAVKR